MTYEDIVQRYAPLSPEIDQVQSKDDGGRPSTLGFNGVDTIEKRTRYAASKIGGLMSETPHWHNYGLVLSILRTVHVVACSHQMRASG